MTTWHNVYLTDKTGKKFWNETVCSSGTMSAIRNLTRHLEAIKSNDKVYSKIDIDSQSAMLMLDDGPYQSIDDILDDDALLSELMN